MIAALDVGFQWREPGWFSLLLLVLWLQWWIARRRAAVPFAGSEWLVGGARPSLPRTWRQRLACVPALLACAALGCLVAALARPVQLETAPPSRPGRDLLLCLDRSSSMLATDLEPGRTRLEIGKQLAAEFVHGRPDDRVGYVEFARYADLRCPPTLDHTTVVELLATITPVQKDGPEDATAIGGAVALAATVLQRSPAKARVLVLMTDGEENVASTASPQEIAPAQAAQFCAAAGVLVHTIVVGNGNVQRDGSFVALDVTAVQQLARATGGRFFVARDTAALRAVYAEIDALAAVEFAAPKVLITEWFPLAVGLSVLLMLVSHVLARTWLQVLP